MRNTIKSSVEISYIFTHGKRYNTSGMTLIVLDAQHDPSGRVAFIAGKKNGNAVWRNAAKRRMRALSADLGGSVPGFNVIFLAKRRILQIPYQKLQDEGKKIMKTLRKKSGEEGNQNNELQK